MTKQDALALLASNPDIADLLDDYETYAGDLDDAEMIRTELEEMCEAVAVDLDDLVEALDQPEPKPTAAEVADSTPERVEIYAALVEAVADGKLSGTGFIFTAPADRLAEVAVAASRDFPGMPVQIISERNRDKWTRDQRFEAQAAFDQRNPVAPRILIVDEGANRNDRTVEWCACRGFTLTLGPR